MNIPSRRRLLVKLIMWLRIKYRLVIMNNDTYEEKFSLSLSPLNVFIVTGTLLIGFTILVISFVAFTPMREFIPGYTDVNLRRKVLNTISRADSLEYQLQVKSLFIENLGNVLRGQTSGNTDSLKQDTTGNYANIILRKSKEDSVLRAEIESVDQYNLSFKEDKQRKSLSAYVFFPPLTGMVSNSFKQRDGHFGVDVVGPENEAIKATLDGTVVLSSWTSDNGYVIQIQHENNIISSYKHNSVLLKKAGDYVKAGEAIAIIGNTGELSSGPHLHFELWHNGMALNPQEYIIF